MLKLSELSFKEKFKLLLNCLIYILFVCFMINSVIKANELSVKILYGSILIICLVIALFYEYLRYMQNSIIDLINNKYDLLQAEKMLKKMRKLDKLNGFKGAYVLLSLILNEEKKDGQAILKILEDNYKSLHGTLDYLLIYRYNQFIANVLLNNHNQVKKCYNKLQELKNAKIKKSKMAPLYNWDMIDAINYCALKDTKKFQKAIKHVNPANMNNREKRQYQTLLDLSNESMSRRG